MKLGRDIKSSWLDICLDYSIYGSDSALFNCIRLSEEVGGKMFRAGIKWIWRLKGLIIVTKLLLE